MNRQGEDMGTTYDEKVHFPWIRFFNILAAMPDKDFAELLVQTIDRGYSIAENADDWIIINEGNLLNIDPPKVVDIFKKFQNTKKKSNWQIEIDLPREIEQLCLVYTTEKDNGGDRSLDANILNQIVILMIIRLFHISFSTKNIYADGNVGNKNLTIREKVQAVNNADRGYVTNTYVIRAIQSLTKEFPKDDLMTILNASRS